MRFSSKKSSGDLSDYCVVGVMMTILILGTYGISNWVTKPSTESGFHVGTYSRTSAFESEISRRQEEIRQEQADLAREQFIEAEAQYRYRYGK